MLYIHYNQTKPNETEFEYAIQGDNNVDVVDFDISDIQLDFEPAHTYVKVQSKDKKYIDKIELSANNSHLLWNLKAKTTRHKIVNVQLSFETEQKCFQTEMVELTLKPYINADQTIGNDYPTVLQDLQAQIDELKEHQGGGGSSEVEIKRIYLTYDDKASIRSDILGTHRIDDIGEPQNFVNDSTRIWYNFETTPINDKMEEEIKNGRFVIRLDYPIHNKTRLLQHCNIVEVGIPNIYSQPTRKYGSGTRGFSYSFKSIGNQKKKEILLNSLIFINENDIKVNRYGEKYIHKKVSMFDYINNMCKLQENYGTGEKVNLQPITNEFVRGEGASFFEAYLYNVFSCGIPALTQHGAKFGVDATLLAGITNKKYYQTFRSVPFMVENVNNNSTKLNPAFSCYTILKTDLINYAIELSSPYFFGNKNFIDLTDFENQLVIKKPNDNAYLGKAGTRRTYMSARPRCAILNDDYENANISFLRTYPQADQQIRLYCKCIKDIDDYGVNLVPIFRTLITQK